MPLLRRRTALIGAASGLMLAREGRGQPSAFQDFAATPLAEGGRPDFAGSWAEVLPFGTNPPSDEEKQEAEAIIQAAPQNEPPIMVAEYFLTLSGDRAQYRGGWPDKWNPLIVAFFRATRTRPTGDLTPWCAAFLNWCLMRAGHAYPENASSGSFRQWGQATDAPTRGDIVVFRAADEQSARLGRGHVGFFVAEREDRVQVLGGNQITRQGHHEISSVWFRKDSAGLRVHSYRVPYKA